MYTFILKNTECKNDKNKQNIICRSPKAAKPQHMENFSTFAKHHLHYGPECVGIYIDMFLSMLELSLLCFLTLLIYEKF